MCGDSDSEEEIGEPIQERAALEKIFREHNTLLNDKSTFASGSSSSIANKHRKPKKSDATIVLFHVDPADNIFHFIGSSVLAAVNISISR